MRKKTNILTERQKQFYRDLISFIDENGYVPTIRELGKYVGFSSPATVTFYLGVLEEKGYIKRINNRSFKMLRGIDD